jgi:hypothetical protein
MFNHKFLLKFVYWKEYTSIFHLFLNTVLGFEAVDVNIHDHSYIIKYFMYTT